MTASPELLSGTCQRLLFSPKGGIEGALLKVKGATLQVSMEPHSGAAFARVAGPGKRVRMLAVADHSPKTRQGAHPVYQFESFADAAGAAVVLPDADAKNVTIKGTVALLHFARHGQPNGVILDGGEFIHLRPHGMAQTGLEVGAKVHAVGELRTTLLGTRMLEAHQVNRVALA